MKKTYLKPEFDAVAVVTGDILLESNEKDKIWEEDVSGDFEKIEPNN